MNLFRSEEHVREFNEARGYEPGVSLSTATTWKLARAWYANRLSPDWRPRPRDESQRILDGLGLTGEFWRLP